MFAGGGAVLPQQMMPQQQQMMPPQQSGGILASSGPLLDAVAAGAINPDGDGGASLSDVQGFANGGLSTSQDLPYITRSRFEKQTGGLSARPDSRFLPVSGMTTDISTQLTGATDEQLRQFISSVDPITQGYVLSQAQSELDRRSSLVSLNTQPVNSLTPSLTPSPLFQPDGDESVGEDPPDFADAVTEGPDANMASLDISTNPNFTGYMDEESTAPGPSGPSDPGGPSGTGGDGPGGSQSGPSGPSGDTSGPGGSTGEDPGEGPGEGPSGPSGPGTDDGNSEDWADGGYFTSRMYNANPGQSGYPNMTAAEEIENGVQRFRRGGSIGPYNPDPRATYDNNSFLLDGQASTRIVPEQIANPQTVSEMMAAMSETGLDTSNADDISPGLMERIRNSLGTNDGSSVAGKGNLLNAMRYTASPSSFMGSTSSLPGQPIDENDPGTDPGQLVDVSWETNTPKPDLETMAKRAAFDDRSGRENTPIETIEGVPTEKGTEFTVASEAEAEVAVSEAEVEGELVGGSQTVEVDPTVSSSESEVENEFNRIQQSVVKKAAKGLLEASNKEDTKTGMTDFINDFKSAMPEYEGMSESEKGYAIMEAGLRIMAGKSSDALTNIAEGLKGLGPQFAKDAKDKRAWNRQIELSAAKYGLETVAKEKAIEQADERKLFFFYDQSPGKVTKSTPYGEQRAISRKQLLDWGGKLPPNLVKGDLVSKSVVGLSASAKSFKKNILANFKAYNITEAESAKIKVELDKTLKTFRQSEAGINLLGMAKARIAKMNTSDGSSIGSFGAAFKDQLNNLANISGADWGKRFKKGKYTNMKLAKADVNMALQALIKADLGSTQAANSISDKDVKLLADAYVDSGFQKNSNSWDLLGLDTKVLGKKLDGALDVFRSNQKAALGVYDGILERFDTVEGKYATVPEMWRMEVDQGPYRRSSFETRLKNVSPYAQALRGRGEGSGGVVSNTGKILRTIVTPTGDFTLNDKNKFVFKPKQGQ